MKLDKDICHISHPHHILKIEHTKKLFRCDGCKEPGIGHRYRCDSCDFDLHKTCALAPIIITHSFYKKCEFHFYCLPPGPVMRICNACGNDVLGFVYHCKNCGFDLHPCCANLPLHLDDGKQSFHLYMKLSDACHRCGCKGMGWSYRSKCKNYSLHVSCVKELLVENWQEMCLNFEKCKIREMNMKVPSLRGAMQNHHSKGEGKVRRCCKIACSAIRIIISAILGDPTAIIAAVIGSFISK